MDRKDDNQSPQGETARILVEFLEVAITSIVFLKGIYPPGAFERRKYMNLVAHRARHPELRDYIHSAVSGLLPFIKKGLVERVAVIFFDSDNNPTERFMVKLTVDHSYGSKVKEPDLEFSLRSFFVKLPFTESVLGFFPQIAGGRLRRTFGPYLGQVQTHVTIATAIIFGYRFDVFQSHSKNDRMIIATVYMFLGGNVEETPQPLKDVIEIIHQKDLQQFRELRKK